MHDRKWMAAATLLGLFALSSPARADETKIKFEDLPKAILKTVKAKFPEAKIRGASKEVEGGETRYEVEMTVDGKNVDALFEPDGEIEAVEKEIDADDLPRAVLKAAKAKFPKGKIEKAEEITLEDDRVVYELIIAAEGKENVEVLLSPSGKIIEKDEAKEDEKGEKKAKKNEKEDDDDEKKGKKSEKEDDDEKGKKNPKKD